MGDLSDDQIPIEQKRVNVSGLPEIRTTQWESGLRELFESDSDGYIVNQKYHYENPFDPMCEILHKTTIHLLEKEDDKVYRVLIDVYPNGHQHIYYRTLCEYVVDKTININGRNYVFYRILF